MYPTLDPRPPFKVTDPDSWRRAIASADEGRGRFLSPPLLIVVDVVVDVDDASSAFDIL